jgi:hypothetical protein
MRAVCTRILSNRSARHVECSIQNGVVVLRSIQAPMKIIPGLEQRSEILSNLAHNIGKRICVELKPYDIAAIADRSGEIHWMYRFDEHENRIFRVYNGSQLFRDIDVETDGPIDVDDLADRIRRIVTDLESAWGETNE